MSPLQHIDRQGDARFQASEEHTLSEGGLHECMRMRWLCCGGETIAGPWGAGAVLLKEGEVTDVRSLEIGADAAEEWYAILRPKLLKIDIRHRQGYIGTTLYYLV